MPLNRPHALFRKQAVEQASQHPPNQVLIYGPPGWRTYLAIILVLMLGIIAALVTIELPRSVRAYGALSPSLGLLQLRPASSGYVSSVHVNVGQTVEKGQVLFELTTDADATVGHTARYHSLLDTEREALAQRLDALARQSELTVARYAARDTELSDSQTAAEQSLELQSERVAISRSTIQSLEQGFAKGAIAKLDIDQANAALLDELRELASMQQTIQQLRAEQNTLPTLRDAELTQLRSQRAELAQAQVGLDQRRSQYSQNRGEQMVAPVAGQLTSLRAKLGDYVSATTSQAAIVPHGSELLAELFLPSSALGYATIGQTVRLRIEPFPHQKFGVITGVLTRVSQVLEEVNAGQPTLGSHVFKAVAKLDRHSFNMAGRVIALQPEMRVEADVVLERRRAWEWLLEPMLQAWRR